MTQPSPNTQITSIDPATEVGLLSLTVADLARSIAFYTDAIGFTVLEQDTSRATLGIAGKQLLLLREHPGATPWPRAGEPVSGSGEPVSGYTKSYTGLYHFAILLPTRADLGRWLGHWLDLGLPLPGQGDHLVSEALYLEDPDGNGIEVYRDRPRDQWQWINGQVQMATDPVDIRGLLDEAERAEEPWNGLPAGTRVGHVHLQVGDIAQAEQFYHQILGFDIVVRMPTALFVSAGGYHHHLGMNIWHSRGAGPAPAGTAGLDFFTIQLPSEEARREVVRRLEAAGVATAQKPESGWPGSDAVVIQDPWQNTILLQVGSTPAVQQFD